MIFVDTNIFIDLVATGVGEPSGWARPALKEAALSDQLAINHVVFAELHGRAETALQFEELRHGLGILVLDLDEAIARRAGIAHGQYRRAGGPRTSILADFLIGAHAATLGIPLITRDAQRFSGYFPELALISPESQP